MIKFDIGGQTILLYEVPYIAVPSLTEASKVTDKQFQEMVASRPNAAQEE